MKFKLPDFFKGLAGSVVSAEFVESGQGSLALADHHKPELHSASNAFCVQLGILLDLRELPVSEETDEERKFREQFNGSPPEIYVVIGIAVYVGCALLARNATAIPERVEESSECGDTTLLFVVDPLASFAPRFIRSQPPADQASSLSNGTYEVECFNSPVSTPELEEANRVFHSTVSSFVHPIISSNPINVRCQALSLQEGQAATELQALIGSLIAKALRSYFIA